MKHENFPLRSVDTRNSTPVSYTHLDVYKRQYLYCAEKNASTGTRKENGSNKAGRTNGLRVLGCLLYTSDKEFAYFYDATGFLSAIQYKLTPTGTEQTYYAAHNWRGDVTGLYLSLIHI